MQELERLPILILYPHSRCNCRCVMCDIWKVGTARELSVSDIERHAADLESLGVRRVVFSGGEPLMHSDLFRLAAVLRPSGVTTTLLTSGLLLKKNAASIAASMDEVIVSLDGPREVHNRIRGIARAFELLESGIQALRDESAVLPVAARCTVQRLNHDRLCDTVETAAELGLNSISFLAADLTSAAFNRPDGWGEERTREVALAAPETDRLEREIEMLIAGLPRRTGFVLESPEKLRRITLHFRAHLGLAEPVAPRCNAPWVSAVIEADGTVRPCFFHRRIGRIGRRSLRQVLNGPEGLAFRSSLDVARDPVCRRCVCSFFLQNSSLEFRQSNSSAGRDEVAQAGGIAPQEARHAAGTGPLVPRGTQRKS
jgi:MoaA/NifB/PqqE/SkfB family radical SAM enzyme